MKKILLIDPPKPHLTNPKVFPSLGWLYVAGAYERAGYKVKCLDLSNVLKDYIQQTNDTILAFKPSVVGITCTAPQSALATEICLNIKETNPEIIVITGGAQPSVRPTDFSAFDKVVIGEGECYVTDDICDTGYVKDINMLSFPARHLIDMNSYHYKLNGRKATSVMTQRGCPFQCTFCCGRNVRMYNRVRYRNPMDVMGELITLHNDYEFNAFMFFDDEFNLNRGRTIDLCKKLEETNFIWRAFIRADLFDNEIAEVMAAAGCVEVGCGVESGSDDMLMETQKGTTSLQNTEARLAAAQYNLRFKAFMVIGLPNETYTDTRLTREWLIENQPDDFDITILNPYPGSKLYDAGCQGLVLREDTINQFYKGKPGEYVPIADTPTLSAERIVEIRDEIDNELCGILGVKH